jgi:UDP-glucuronate 4-epimerase
VDTKSTVLVTGAAGFIGSHVAEALLRRGDSVIGLDNFDTYYDRARKLANLAEVRATASSTGAPFEFIEGDILDDAALGKAFVGGRCGGVVHLAARAGVRPSIAQPVLYARVNVEGTTRLLQAASQARCGSFVCASSSSVYGNNPKVPFGEADAVDHPISPYAATKKACELIGHTFHHLTRMPVAMLRFFTVFGPRQRPDLAISMFLEKVSRGEAIRVFGDGSASRDYTFIDDITAGVLAALDRAPSFGYRVWNLGGDKPTTLSEMIATVERVVGRPATIERAPAQPGDVERTWADLSRSRAELGFTPRTRFEDGVRAQLEWLRNRPATG